MKVTLILFLFISILNNAEFKQNTLTQIEDLEDPILEARPRVLKSEASKAIKSLTGISIDFGTKEFNKDYVLIKNKQMIATAKLSTSCTRGTKLRNFGGIVTIQEGKIIENKLIELMTRQFEIYKILVNRFDLAKTIINNFLSKYKDVIPNGSFIFNLDTDLVTFEFIFIPKGETICDGKLIVRLIPFDNIDLSSI